MIPPTSQKPLASPGVQMLLDWISRCSATFFGAFLALILFALLVRFYFEMTVGKAIGGLNKAPTPMFKPIEPPQPKVK